MALDFPASPSNGDTYAAPNGVLYTYDAAAGLWYVGAAGNVNTADIVDGAVTAPKLASDISITTTGNISAVDGTFSGDIDLGSGNIQLNADGTASFGGGDVNVDSSGNVGIGTTSPTQKLHIYDTNNAYLQLTTAGSTQSAFGGFQLIHNGAGDLRANIVQRENAPMTFLTNDIERMRIGNAGKIQIIGNSYLRFDPAEATNGTYLQFTSSQFRIGNDSSGSGNYVYLVPGGTSWVGTSDERFKTGLVEIQDGLSKVSTLRAVTGRYTTDPETESRSFLIAQDVVAVLPEAVDAADPEKLGLRYTDTIPLLVAALKESKERIEALEAKVQTLEGGAS